MAKQQMTWKEFTDYVKNASPVVKLALDRKKELLKRYDLDTTDVDQMISEYSEYEELIKAGVNNPEQQQLMVTIIEDFYKSEVEVLNDADKRIEEIEGQ